jgi:hypothetical protein
MFNGKERGDFVVLEDDLALGIENEADIKKAVFDFGMARFGLRHDEGVILAGDFAQFIRLLAWNVNRALTRKLHMIEVKHFVIEALQRALWKGNEAYRKVETGEPGGGFHQVRKVFEVAANV